MGMLLGELEAGSWASSLPLGLALVAGLAAFTSAVLAGTVWRARRQAQHLRRALRAFERQAKAAAPVPRAPWGELADAANAVLPALRERVGQLEADQRQLRAVLETMTEGVVVVDADRRLRFANPAARKLFGLDDGSLGRLVPELIRSPAIRDAIDATLATSGPGPYRGEVRLASRDRDALPRLNALILAVNGTPVPGNPPEALLVFHNITELRRLERMRQDFVANVSHELKTPLASIRAYTETLLDWALEDPGVNERFVRQIDEQAERLDLLIHDLLSLARIESGEDILRPKPIALGAFVKERVDSFRDRAEARGVRLVLKSVFRPHLRVRADAEALRQILDNLLDNAIKYTDPDRGWVKVFCRRENRGRTLAVDIVDNGIGIPRDEQERVFERFYRVDKARSRAVGGTGLGLSIVKHLVQAIGAEIELQSRMGSGSRFTVRFPRLADAPRGEYGDDPDARREATDSEPDSDSDSDSNEELETPSEEDSALEIRDEPGTETETRT